MKELITQEWYESLVDDCKSIVVEAEFTSRWALVEGYWNFGKRLKEDKNFNTKLLQRVAVDVGISERTAWYALKTYDKYPELGKLPEGKNLSWKRLITKYLPSPKEEEEKEITKTNASVKKGDFKKVLNDLYEIDAIITDPPYPQEFLDCFSELGKYASEHLKEDGFVAVYSGQYHLPEVIRRLSEHLTYVWTFCLYHIGKKQLVNGVNIMCGWKPVLIFSRGRKKMRFSAYDVLISEQREKNNHEWQQSESGVKGLIEILTKPGELVVDPFAGSGTFIKVAQQLGRKAIGAEIK
jgi:hypothetical protein